MRIRSFFSFFFRRATNENSILNRIERARKFVACSLNDYSKSDVRCKFLKIANIEIKISDGVKISVPPFPRTWGEKMTLFNVETLLSTIFTRRACVAAKAAFRKYESAALFIIHKPIGSVREHFRLGVRAGDRHVHASIHSRMIASIKPWRHACVLAGSRVQKRDNDVQLQSVCLSEGKWGERVLRRLTSTMFNWLFMVRSILRKDRFVSKNWRNDD